MARRISGARPKLSKDMECSRVESASRSGHRGRRHQRHKEAAMLQAGARWVNNRIIKQLIVLPRAICRRAGAQVLGGSGSKVGAAVDVYGLPGGVLPPGA